MTRVVTWWIFLRISIEERLVYRGDFMLGTLMRFLPIVTQVFLWNAIFDAPATRTAAGMKVCPPLPEPSILVTMRPSSGQAL